MYAVVQKQKAFVSNLFRIFGRVSALLIVMFWLVLVIEEFFHQGPPVIANYYQGAMLAIVFVGYALGWRHEVAGGALTILGTIGFIVVNALLFSHLPLSGAIGFAAPGVFYLLAHFANGRQVAEGELRP